jgi:hypothetical protein
MPPAPGSTPPLSSPTSRCRSKDDLVRAIITREAAERTLGHFGEPQTPEGQEARNALAKQKRDAEIAVDDLVKQALEQAQIVQGGGQIVDEGSSLEDRLKRPAPMPPPDSSANSTWSTRWAGARRSKTPSAA